MYYAYNRVLSDAISLACLFANLIVGGLVFLNSDRSRLHATYGISTLIFVCLTIANSFSMLENDNQLFWIRAVMVFATLAVTAVLYLVLFMRDPYGRVPRWQVLLLIFTGIMVLYDMSPLLFAGMSNDAHPLVAPGDFPYLFFIHFITILVAAIVVIIRSIIHARGRLRHQFKYVLYGILPTLLLAPITGVILPMYAGNEDLIMVTPVYITFFVICVGYAVARHGLFDIKRTAMRTLVYFLSIVSMAGVYVGLAYFASATLFHDSMTSGISVSPVNIILALILAFVFQPIKRFFDRLTNRLFFRDQYDTNRFVERLGKVLTSTTRLGDLLRHSLAEITSTLKAESGLMIIYREDQHDTIVGSRALNSFDDDEYALLRRVMELRGGSGVIVVADIDQRRDRETARMKRLLTKRHIELVLPLFSSVDLVGYLLLGEQQSTGYTKRDVNALSMIANELVIAILNARSVQAVRDANSHLEDRVESATRELRDSNTRLLALDATKDEFVSMASHQLRTPLTSVKGYISMVLEGDAGEISDAQRQLLGEAFMSSERMVHLIGDFLNVSRLQNGKFLIDRHAVDLAQIVNQEVDGMRQIALTHGMTITCRVPRSCPKLYLDEGKIRQVIMNFIDNAIYYAPESKTIKVTLAKEGSDLVFRVIDHGMGVPPEAQKKLFSKFFRADNARKQRPDGTGIGIYLAKQIIDGHHGKIVFESALGEGSTFGFRLPIKRLSSAPPPIDNI